MHQPLLDLLQPVRLLSDMDYFAEDHGTPLERAVRSPAAGQSAWGQALALRMGPVPGDGIPV